MNHENDAKTIYGTRFNKDDHRMITLTDCIITEHEAGRVNIRFKDDEITLLGDTLILGMDEAREVNGYVSTGMNERFLNIKVKTLK